MVEPIAPELPGGIVARLQEGRYAEAAEEIASWGAAEEADAARRSYAALIRGIALRLDGRPDAARQALQDALEADPDGRWSAKLRAELAATELAANRPEQAEALARAQVEVLLDPGRKDELAGVYIAFADDLLEPEGPTAQPDPEAAHALLEQARSLAKGDRLRARILVRMGRASQEAGNPGRAVSEFQSYLDEYPDGDDRLQARLHLAEAQLDSGQPLPARLTATDLARDLEKAGGDEADAIRPEALILVARSHGLPSPQASDEEVELGIAALNRFLDDYPSHRLTPQAVLWIAEAARDRQQTQRALDVYRAFLGEDRFRPEGDEAEEAFAEARMRIAFEVGELLRDQGRFAEAIDAFKGYLAQYPDGPESADAQREILNTQLMIADEQFRKERFDEARASWRQFVSANPLDARVPELLFRIGQSFATQERFDEAIASWETLVGKFPGTEPAGHAQFRIGEVLETKRNQPEQAIERYKRVSVEPWQSQARLRIAVMESTELTVVTPRAFRSGEVPTLEITTRNISTLTFRAYALNAEAYFRKKESLDRVESLDIGLVAPDAEWTVEVPEYTKYVPMEHKYALDKVSVPGVHVVRVSDEEKLQATTLVVGSDLDAIVKTSRDQLLVFAQDMTDGSGRAGARVLVAQGGEILLEERTGADGVLLASWPKPVEPGLGLSYLIVDGPHVAGTGLGVPQTVAQGLSPRAYLSTDRPAYRPGQEVALRGVVREVVDGQYHHAPGETYRLEIVDSRGRRILEKSVTLSEFGTFHETVPVDSSAPVGTYQIRLYQPGKSSFSGSFEVQAYQLQKVDLAIEFPRSVYFRGETVEGKAVARYQYGAPVSGRTIMVSLPDGRTLTGETDEAGAYEFSFETTGFGEEQPLRVVAQLPQEGVAAVSAATLAVRAFRIDLSTPRDVYLDGEPFHLTARTIDALGEPTGQELEVAILKRVTQQGTVAERPVETKTLTTSEETGEAALALSIDDDEGGTYVLRASGTDRFGNPILADRILTISGSGDEEKLRILADSLAFKVGETAEVNLFNRSGSGPALLTWEADRILDYKVVSLDEGNNPIRWEAVDAQFPNVTLAAARMAGTEFHRAEADITLARDLRVTVEPSRESVGPGEELEVVITATDQLGRPVRAEVALALVDRALLRLFDDPLPPIGPFFHDQTRTGAFATEATNTFRYDPGTEAIADALLEEKQRLELEALAERELDAARDRAAEAFDYAGITDGVSGMGAMGGMGGYAGGQGQMMEQRQALPAPEAAPMPGFEPRMGEMLGRASRRQRGASVFRADQRAGGLRLEEAAKSEAFFDSPNGRPLAAGTTLGFRFGMDAGAGRAPMTREQFTETAYWNPSIVTGEDGTARVTITAPTALSRYRFTARGVTAADTLAGETTADLLVTQDFFVELRTPSILTEGDKPRFLARVHHSGVKGRIDVRLSSYASGREQVDPKTIEVDGDGVTEVLFDPFEVPDAAEVELTLTARAGDRGDEIRATVPVRPWGVRAIASASGSSDDDATVFVELPAGRRYEAPEMLITLSSSTRRLLIELALGQQFWLGRPAADDAVFRICFPTPETVADRASDLVAATSALAYLRRIGGAEAPEAERLTDRIRGLAAELVALQNEDGGWPWVPGRPEARGASDRLTSGYALWALSSAEPLGLLSDPGVADRAASWIEQEFARVDASDRDTRAALLFALSTRGRASFEQANRLNRDRQELTNPGLAFLALTFANLDRSSLASEVIGVLGPRSKAAPAEPGGEILRSWEADSRHPFFRGTAEVTALAALAYSRGRPDADELGQAVAWLMAHRIGLGWDPHKAKGPAVAALGRYYGEAEASGDDYRLVVSVNDQEVHRADVSGRAEGVSVRVPRKAIDPSGRNRVRFDIEGRGTFGYSVALAGFTREFGPDQDRRDRSSFIDRRVFLAAEPEFEGRTLPSGFSVAVNPQTFRNEVTQVALGGRARVEVSAARVTRSGEPGWERDFLVLEEPLPAGATLVEGSVQTGASHFEVTDGVLTFYFAPDQYPGTSSYEVFGFLPGSYRALPPTLRSAYEPGRYHLGQPGDLTVLEPGKAPTDSYRPTPDELYARGQALFGQDRFAEAAEALGALWSGYTLRDDVARDAARMLLSAHIALGNPRPIVQFFEILREKAPDVVIPFDEILAVGGAYRDIGEDERAFLVWRATAEASYLEDARVGEALRQRGKPLEAVAYLLDLWRAYPNTASIESDFFGLSQVLARLAVDAGSDPALRSALLEADLAPPQLLLQSIRLVQAFLAQSPANPIADEASLALVNTYLDLKDHETVVSLAERFAGLYGSSEYLDSFRYSEALGRFRLGQYDRAIAVAETIANATYRDDSGAEVPSPNKWQALYILGQIYHARRDAAKAVSYYEQVADRFTDAAGAIRQLTREELELPEITLIRPSDVAGLAAAGRGDGAVRALLVAGAPEDEEEPEGPTVPLESRNIKEAAVTVYPVDLMRLYLTRRNLDDIAGIDLAGITPLVETTVPLGDGADFDAKETPIPLPLESEGAYLVMIRGDDRYASGIALVSPLELDVLEEPEAGRVRVTVRLAETGELVPDVQVRVIGSGNERFFSGETDLRGVFVAEGVRGQVTAVARREGDQYAFYRGTSPVGAPEPPSAPAESPASTAEPSLEENLRLQNSANQLRQIERLQQRYQDTGKGVQVDKAY
ncbi:tetratricopeptide repeat protein [Tautonia sociabilis]|uniref:Tetratricopeptide repeat protein n=1 Tax=Tautonia sociabilis TaxID=2080755 RepID=A0A432MP22_9BACT|nr:tetratricopeptide repeat protein [Tautonia sociabilis]RUL89070.1 tetratricopeptide repeat protein [Tautonia sociabilis]